MDEQRREPGAIDMSGTGAAMLSEMRRLPERLATAQGTRLYRLVGLLLLAAILFRYFDAISYMLLIAFVGVIIAIALNAIVVRIPIRRGIATAIVGLTIMALVVAGVWLGISQLLGQLRGVAADLRNLEPMVRNLEAWIQAQLGMEIDLLGDDTQQLLSDPIGIGTQLFTRAFGILEIVGLSVLVFFGAIFIVAKPNDQLLNTFLRGVPRERRPAVRRMLGMMGYRLLGWLRGTLISMAIIGFLSGLAFWLIGVPYALLLGLWVGLIEIIPIVGPWIGGATAIVVTLFYDPGIVVWVIVAVLAIQQIEGNIVRPFVMSSAAELHPFVTLLALLLFATMFGFLGALLALPLVLVIGTAIEVLWVEETIGTDDDEIRPVVEE